VLWIDTNGNVTPYVGSSANWFSIEGEFDTESVLLTASVAAQPIEPWHQVDVVGGTTGEPKFQNGWVNFGSGYHNIAFRKTPDGKVLLRGLAKTGASGTVIFTLPVGYRPPATVLCAVWSSGTALASGVVNTDGTVVASGAAVSTSVSLDTIEFDTDSVTSYATGALNVPLVSALPLLPYDGMEIYYQNATLAALGVAWHLRYRAAASGTYKWEFLGGGPWSVYESATHNPLTNTTWVDKNGGPTLALPFAGDWELTWTNVVYCSPNNYCYSAYFDASNVMLSDYSYQGNFSGFGATLSMTSKITIATAQTIKPRVQVGGGSGFVTSMRTQVRPIRVG